MEFITNNINEINLEYTPHSKALLEIYVKASDAEMVVTNKFLKCKLIRLLQTSNLVDLIIFEYMTSADYDGRTEVSLEDVNLNYTPHTKHLLKQYLSNQFEGTIDPTPETLKEVLLDLHKNDRQENDSPEKDNLGSLIVGEWIYSPGGFEPVAKLQIDSKKLEVNHLKEMVKNELQTLGKFISFKDSCIMRNSKEFLNSNKKFKYINFNEDKNDLTFSNEALSPINIQSASKGRDVYQKLYEMIANQEKKIGNLINPFLENYGIELPPNYGFKSFEE